MKTAYNCFNKRAWDPLKKIKFVFKNKTETGIPNINFFGGACEFCFTNM